MSGEHSEVTMNKNDAFTMEDSTIAIGSLANESAVADTPRKRGTTNCIKKAASKKKPAAIKFPRCDAAVRKWEGSEWEMADAILAECSETGGDGVRNGSNAKMKTMQEEIAKNHSVDLSFERIRKLRTLASAFPPGRRRPGVSVQGHIESGTPEALDEVIKSAPKGTVLTCAYIRQLKYRDEKTEQDQHKDERRRQVEDQRTALQNLCRQLERQKEQREKHYEELCHSIGREPEPFPPPQAPADGPSPTIAEDLAQSVRVLLLSRGFDPTTDNLKEAIADFVKAVLAVQQ
jgi:hypothetical protein